MGTPPSNECFANHRTAGISKHGGITSIRNGTWDIIQQIEIFPNYPVGGLFFIIPRNDVPPGNQRKIGQRTIDGTLEGRLTQGAEQTAAKERREWIGRAILTFWLPTGSTRGGGLQAWSFRSRCLSLLRIVDECLEDMPPDVGDFWPYILRHQASDFSSITFAQRSKADMHAACEILARASEEGLMLARPPVETVRHTDRVEESYSDEYISIRGEKAKQKKKKKPFSNEFVSDLLGRSFWIQDNLAPTLIQVLKIYRNAQVNGASSSDQLRVVRKSILNEVEWRDANGELITQLPFPFKQRVDGNRYELSDTWPPAKFSTIRLLARVLQVSNLCTVAFCTAARIHEIHGFKRKDGAVVTDGIVIGTTYKNTRRQNGIGRDWPLHDRGWKALQLQEQLAELFRDDDQHHLWVTLKEGDDPAGSPLSNASGACVSVVDYLGLSEKSEGRAHLHRWRHTAARIIGITVERAPEVLIDLFGTDYEAVLIYLLSDPEIAAECIRVAEECLHALAEDAVEECEIGAAGGAAGKAINIGLQNLKMKRGIKQLGTDDIRDAADQLIAEGTSFQVVRRGVICTKQPGEFGPCTQTLRKPDKGSCRSTCNHRLEMAAEKQQCRRQLLAILEMLEASISDGKVMVVEHLKGQLIYELKRWDDIRQDLLAESELARAVWNDTAS